MIAGNDVGVEHAVEVGEVEESRAESAARSSLYQAASTVRVRGTIEVGSSGSSRATA
ncbi:hypothetical protein [Halalkalicoccus salilacus]|uniref:hypothetical protein n=1 Tax=Halalkalicoccus sp. GCM10025704 TaxID=3252662 RepID=UPI00361834BC